MKIVNRFLLIVFFCSINISLAQQGEHRVALVIGNGAYKNAPLVNPTNDSKDMATKLKSMGFVVIERSNLGIKQIGSTLREFRSALKPGGVGLVFYAGHGLQIKGENYLPAVDAEINSEEDVPNQSLSMRQIMDILSDAKTRMNLVFLDACRNNPYARSFRSSANGLSRLDAPTGTLISFATRPGSVASDGGGRNGLYTSFLLQEINNKSLPIEQVLKRVVIGVKASSKGQQEPWMEGSIEGEFCFGSCEQRQGTESNLAPSAITISPIEEKFWADVKATGNKQAYEAYLARFPVGIYSDLANANLIRLNNNATTSISAAGEGNPNTNPIDDAIRVSEHLGARGRIGVQIDQVTKDVAESIGLGKPLGALVRGLEPGSPADNAGIEAGDIITKLDGIVIEKSSDLPPLVSKTKPGTRSTLTVFRRGYTKELMVTIGEFVSDKPVQVKSEKDDRPKGMSTFSNFFKNKGSTIAFGLTVSDLTDVQKRELKVKGGVLVEAVADAVARAGLREGDVIVSVANREINSVKELEALLANVEKNKPLSLLFRRGVWAQYIVIKS